MNLQKLNYINLHQEIAQTPQDHLSVDLIGPYNTATQGNTYALRVICNLRGYLMTTPIPSKKASTVAVQSFLEILLKLGFPRILHPDNGTDFKLKITEHPTQQLGVKKLYICPHHSSSNGKLESSHRFIKDFIQIFSINGVLELDQLLPYATTAFNQFPNEHF